MKRIFAISALLAPLMAGATGYMPVQPCDDPAAAFAGFNFAAELGASQFMVKEVRHDVTTPLNTFNDFGSIVGFDGTLLLGYLYPMSTRWLIGLDGFINYPFNTEYFKFNTNNVNTGEDTYFKLLLNWQAGIEAQLAYAVNSASLLGFSIGAAWNQWQANGSYTNTAVPAVTVSTSQTTTNIGLTIAGTGEQSLFKGTSWENLRLIEQYRLVFSPNMNVMRPISTSISSTGFTNSELSWFIAQTATVGLSYTFNL